MSAVRIRRPVSQPAHGGHRSRPVARFQGKRRRQRCRPPRPDDRLGLTEGRRWKRSDIRRLGIPPLDDRLDRGERELVSSVNAREVAFRPPQDPEQGAFGPATGDPIASNGPKASTGRRSRGRQPIKRLCRSGRNFDTVAASVSATPDFRRGGAEQA